MGKVTGFMEVKRGAQPYRPVEQRLLDWNQVMAPWQLEPLKGSSSTLYGLRYSVLSSRLSVRKFNP